MTERIFFYIIKSHRGTMCDEDLIKLNDKLKNDNIFISLEELKEVIDIYDKRVTFMKEILGQKPGNNFEFIHLKKSMYYEIFKKIQHPL